ncbi:gliding motility-associated ABC transporter ATP-binding subunit GldA [Lutibacter sp. HS1-25]|uniref:gliding motility-associated ABC transporter ATP-binding subunit GldA n=1 Tax=Lutibacter sp. HS1-25 TaxID=2485000 RepID=UPI00101355CD|nr:gliding motility-associated ABC transporter ATP-binding subunit GldA [Lutibacter sp. HS1-25]RXP57890.1 gliding motility-associated ABC transporter ATP-binding subunit GldA [Lutibacter sp. HS1-25]
MSIEVKNITKLYGEQQALNNVSFTINKGEIVGFLGPNGAGKSTMMKIITGYIDASEGAVIVNNFDIFIDKIAAQKSIGYLPEHNPLYLDMYVREYLQFNAEIHKIAKVEVENCIQKVGLTPEAHKKINQLSKGYRQRVGLAAALLHNPEVLILDEPTTGLDPNQLLEVRNLIKEVGKDKTVLFSTHIMQEVEAICNRVIVINKGQLIVDKKLSDFKENEEQIIEVEFDFKIEKRFFESIPYLKSADNFHDTSWVLTFSTTIDMRSKVFDFAHDNGLKILQLNTKNKNLESLFRALTT